MKSTLCLAIFILAFYANAAFSTCQVSRSDVLASLKAGVTPEQLVKKYSDCTAVDTKGFASPVAAVVNAIGQTIKDTGSTYYEALTSCGYHPQRKELTCPIEICQRNGFSGLPALQPAGSYEYVLFCVDTGAGLVPVNTNGVHIHNEAYGEVPNWYFSAVVPANQQLFSMPLRGQTLRARAILSWAMPPAGCGATPVWGNQADFRIRLDP